MGDEQLHSSLHLYLEQVRPGRAGKQCAEEPTYTACLAVMSLANKFLIYPLVFSVFFFFFGMCFKNIT